LAFELDVRLKAGSVTSRPKTLLIEHPATIKPAQDEVVPTLFAEAFDITRDVLRPAHGHVSGAHSSKPNVKSKA
jgi:hypothetical protein